jgi:hypothetical protein
MTRSTTIPVVFTVFFILCSIPATVLSQQNGPFIFKFDGGGYHQSEADLSDTDGGFSKDRWFLSAGLDYGWNARTSLGVSVGTGRSIYDFNEFTSLGGEAPWDTIEDSRLTVTGRFGVGETATVLIIPTMRLNGEKGASTSDGRTYGLFSAIAWRINENLTIGPGIGIFSRLENGTRFFPVLVIDWNINDRWSLSTGRGLASSQGPGLTLGYKLNQDWSLGLSGRWEDVEFRLDDEGPAAGGVGRDQSVPMVFRADLKPNDVLSLSIFTGLEFFGKLKLKDADGLVIDESKYDPALIVGGTFEFRF